MLELRVVRAGADGTSAGDDGTRLFEALGRARWPTCRARASPAPS